MARTRTRAAHRTAARTIDWPVSIERLAELVGMSPRNIRAHQTRGILPPPIKRGRFACYDQRHETVLRRIKELQAKGYSLAAIDEALRAPEDSNLLQRLVLAPLLDRDEVVLTWEQIAGMYDQRPDAERYRRAVDAGLVREAADGVLVAPSATLLRAARQVIDMGVPFQEVFDLQVATAEQGKSIADRFVSLCLESALAPYPGEVPPELWPEVSQRFEELYRLMATVLTASFTVAVRRAASSLLTERDEASRTATSPSTGRRSKREPARSQAR
jgi:DNA-binding transcriptional MerR regulator